jgi:ABC-type branched-subunit amino acid transport system permease subunit
MKHAVEHIDFVGPQAAKRLAVVMSAAVAAVAGERQRA